jgi:hypothetical protein
MASLIFDIAVISFANSTGLLGRSAGASSGARRKNGFTSDSDVTFQRVEAFE